MYFKISMRAELFHPMVIHFPLVLLLTGVVLRFIHPFVKKTKFGTHVLYAALILLGLGVCSAWVAIAAGEVAEPIVRPKLCRPEHLDSHMHLAYVAAYLFSIGFVLDVVAIWKKRHGSLRKILLCLTALCYIAASVILIFTGDYGAGLVYSQGAAVENICH